MYKEKKTCDVGQIRKGNHNVMTIRKTPIKRPCLVLGTKYLIVYAYHHFHESTHDSQGPICIPFCIRCSNQIFFSIHQTMDGLWLLVFFFFSFFFPLFCLVDVVKGNGEEGDDCDVRIMRQWAKKRKRVASIEMLTIWKWGLIGSFNDPER